MSNVAAPFRVRYDTQAKACDYRTNNQEAVQELHERILLTAGGKLLAFYRAILECASSACAQNQSFWTPNCYPLTLPRIPPGLGPSLDLSMNTIRALGTKQITL